MSNIEGPDADIIPLPGVNLDNKTASDESALASQLLGMVSAGQDGVEAGLSTTEFWLTALAVAIDIEGPHLGFLQGINANEQGLIALGLVIAYTGFRSWRKRGGFAALLAKARAAQPTPGPTAPAVAKAA